MTPFHRVLGAQPDALPPLRLAIGADRAGQEYKDALAEHLRKQPLVASVLDVGVHLRSECAYPQIAEEAARHVAEATVDKALLICHTGLGMAVAANKVPGIRAVTAHDSLSVRASVLSNNAQVLTFGAGIVGLALAKQLAEEWLAHRFDPNASAARKVQMIHDLERTGRIIPPPVP
ncbi:RpiB/LacA/LacB family sugar-phosphate isomerase [Streptomyces anulatus]|uniref:D-erythrulose 4-phosphate isomerase n=2 Tax=Streptomyces TaxID=1883 RepID=A0A7K3RF03_STRAQ|nr:RpiB/LacA/LacB family sugar-phosphate isomerase [Streptomyces anulatus]NEC00788.1 RpiB/LacA/LacB family sugar-phosphate isomerase [Streptomyces anulatus]NED25741.1 RpiB/LacA/LacB family sugar-phosphate isomerase [Streptomyces anulatus]NEE05968.1 RpiB/LacA/LacB family sugar-phosphate isomerase [Streptomyces sp. SID7499]